MTCVKFALALTWVLIGFTSSSSLGQAQTAGPGASSTSPIRVQFQESDLSDRGSPPEREDGGTRGNCPAVTAIGNKDLIALVPETGEALTVAESPTFRFSVPYSPASPLSFSFVLRDENGARVPIEPVEKPLSGTPGIVSVRLSKPLELGKRYQWYFSILCDPVKRSKNPVVNGWVRRVELSSALKSQFNQLPPASPRDRAIFYAQKGFWHDALDLLAERRATDPQAAADWADLLQSVGLEAISSEPFVQCCTP